MAPGGRRIRCTIAVATVASGALWCIALTGCASATADRSLTTVERTPSANSVFLPERTLERRQRTLRVFAHQNPEFARRDSLLGVR